MKKLLRSLMLMAAMLLPFASQAQVTVEIGDPTATTTNYTLPVNMFYHYSLTQQIFSSDEIEMAGTITSISFEYTNTAAFSMDSVRLYMKNVDKESFASSTDMEPVSSSDLVWEGTLSATGAGWVTITLPTPFAYDGASNLLVCMYDRVNGYPGNAFKYRTTATSSYLALAYYSDSAIPSVEDVSSFSGSKTRYQYRDNIRLGITPTASYCAKPASLTVSGITENSADLAWASTTNNYSLEYKVSTDTLWTEVSLTDTTYTLNSLQANTVYNVRVKSICDGGAESGYRTSSFRTACTAITQLPVTWTFEEDELVSTTNNADMLPFCWSRYNSEATNAYYPYSYASSYAHSGGRSLYYLSTTSASYPNVMIASLPQIDVTTYPMDANRLVFWARTQTASNSRVVYVGTMSDPSSQTNFTIVDSVVVSGTEYTRYVVPLSSAVSTDAYAAFMVNKANTGNLYIDDVTLEEIPACMDVENLSIVDSLTTSSSITISWIDTVNDGAFYTIFNMADTTELGTTNTGDTTFTVVDLAPSTLYTFGVQSNCATGDGVFLTISGLTACGPVELPFYESFDATLSNHPCWSGASKVASEVFAGDSLILTVPTSWNYTSSVRDGLPGGHYYKNVYGTNVKHWMITPEIDLSRASEPVLSFDVALTDYNNAALPDANGDTNSSQAFYVIISTDGGNTWLDTNATKWQNVPGADYTYASLASTAYQTKIIDLSAYQGDTIRIAFYCQSIWSGGDNDLHIDNISVTDGAPDICNPPTALAAPVVDANCVTLTWDGSADAYIIVDMDNPSNVIASGSAESFAYESAYGYQICGLTSATQYTFGILANCTDNFSDTVIITLNTACEALTFPFAEDFSASVNDNPCWAGASKLASEVFAGQPLTLTTPGWTYASAVRDGIPAGHYYKNVYGVSCYSWMITPEIDLDSVTSPVLTFDAVLTKWNAAQPAQGDITDDKFLVIVSTDGGQTWDSTNAFSVDLNTLIDTVYHSVSVNLSAFVGNTVRIAFYAESTVAGGDNDLHIDNISLATSTPEPLDSVIVVVVPGIPIHGSVTLDGGTVFGAGSILVAHVGDVINATAIPDSGYVFSYWTVGYVDDDLTVTSDSVIANPYTFTIDTTLVGLSMIRMQAYFEAISGEEDSLTVFLATANEAMGTTNPVPGQYRVAFGDSLIFSAVPTSGYHFLYWIRTRWMPGSTNTYVDTLYEEGPYAIVCDNMTQQATVIFTAYFEVNPVTYEESTIAASDIEYWVGSGSNQVVMAVNWADVAYAWGVRFSGESITVQDALDTIELYDPRFDWIEGAWGLGDITFNEGEISLSGVPGSYWESKRNGYMDAGLAQTLEDGDFEKWAEPAAGIITDSVYYGEEWGWSYIYTYTAEIIPMWAPQIEPEYVSVTFTVNDPARGSINPSGTQQFEVGDILTVTATPNEGYRLVSWTLTIDGESFTADEDIQNTYTDTVDIMLDGAIITANFEAVQQGIEDVEAANFQAYSIDGKVVVKGVENRDVNVYDMTGRSVNSVAKATETVEFTVPVAGVYMVKVGNAVKRVVVIR